MSDGRHVQLSGGYRKVDGFMSSDVHTLNVAPAVSGEVQNGIEEF